MELDYYILNLYSNKKKKQLEATEKLMINIEENFLEESEVIEICVKYDSVVLIEVEQDDGYSETILVDNKGKVRKRLVISIETIGLAKTKINEMGLEKYFGERKMQYIYDFIKQYNYTIGEFKDEFIGEFLLDQYEKDKNYLSSNIKDYYN